MSTVRKLVFTGKEPSIETLPLPESPADTVSITVDTVLMPPIAVDKGLWSGYSAESPTVRYIGWGPAAEHLYVMRENMLAVPQSYDTPLMAALYLPACAIALALDNFTPPMTVGVVGQGLLADLARDILASRGFSLEQEEQEADLELLVDTESDSHLWVNNLASLHAHGTLLLFVPPWSGPVNFNFYAQVHSRSLRMIASRWHCPPQEIVLEQADALHPIVSRVVKESPWLRPLDLDGAAMTVWVWQWIDWVSHRILYETEQGT